MFNHKLAKKKITTLSLFADIIPAFLRIFKGVPEVGWEGYMKPNPIVQVRVTKVEGRTVSYRWLDDMHRYPEGLFGTEQHASFIRFRICYVEQPKPYARNPE